MLLFENCEIIWFLFIWCEEGDSEFMKCYCWYLIEMVIDVKNIEKDKKFVTNLLLIYVFTFRIIIF